MARFTQLLRSALQDDTLRDPLVQGDIFFAADVFVNDVTDATDSAALLQEAESDLLSAHRGLDDEHTPFFIELLYHLLTVLPSRSILASWFDLTLKPALRDAKLSATVVGYAQDLIVSALTRGDQDSIVADFRRRLLEYYLLDAFNDSSGRDILEWAELSPAEQDERSRWKTNLKQILLRCGKEQPEALMTEIHSQFADVNHRLQILTFLSIYTSDDSFPKVASVFASHPLLRSLLYSLLLDESSTACCLSLATFVELLPILAVHACDQLKAILPDLLAILAKVVCWKGRTPKPSEDPEEDNLIEVEGEDDAEQDKSLTIREDLQWDPLNSAFGATSPPSPRRYFSLLYYLFPCNVLHFLRHPASYLDDHGLESPYTISWKQALDEPYIRSTSESLLRCHSCHPSIVWRDAATELMEQDSWAEFDISRISSEAVMLDISNQLVAQNGISVEDPTFRPPHSVDTTPAALRARDLPPEVSQTSLNDLVRTIVTLRSGKSINIHDHLAPLSPALFSDIPHSFPGANKQAASSSTSIFSRSSRTSTEDAVPWHVAEAISSLQREVILLRSELNIEVWLSRENVKHISRLHSDRILSDNVEAERQGLFNKLRNYRSQVSQLQKEVQEQKAQALSTRKTYTNWINELTTKNTTFREEKKKWTSEAASLRTVAREANDRFEAQSKRLAETLQQVFELETQKRAVQHKIDRLHDYEQRIDQHVKVQQLWDADFLKFQQREEEMEEMKSQFKQMEIRMKTLEEIIVEHEDRDRVSRRRIQTLEAQMQENRHRHRRATNASIQKDIASSAQEKKRLMKSNEKLREQNEDLLHEVEELQAMVEVLKMQVQQKQGLIAEQRGSPLQSPPL